MTTKQKIRVAGRVVVIATQTLLINIVQIKKMDRKYELMILGGSIVAGVAVNLLTSEEV
jgi:hypothetical protein